MARPPLENGKKTKGRQRIEYRLIENKAARQVTFSKRKDGIWKKVSETALQCRTRLFVVVISETGRVFALGSPSADAVLGCGGDTDVLDSEWEALDAVSREAKEKGAEAKAEAKRMAAVKEKVMELKKQTGKRFWWDVDQAALGEPELPVFHWSLQRLRANFYRRCADQLQSTPPPPQ